MSASNLDVYRQWVLDARVTNVSLQQFKDHQTDILLATAIVKEIEIESRSYMYLPVCGNRQEDMLGIKFVLHIHH